MKPNTSSQKYRVMRHLLNYGPLTAVEAVKKDISANLRNRVVELREMGFDIAKTMPKGENYKVYSVPTERLEKNREMFKSVFYGN